MESLLELAVVVVETSVEAVAVHTSVESVVSRMVVLGKVHIAVCRNTSPFRFEILRNPF